MHRSLDVKSWSAFMLNRSEGPRRPAMWLVSLRLGMLLLPAALLLGGALRSGLDGTQRCILLLAAACQLCLCLLSVRTLRDWARPLAPTILLLYVTGLGWLWIGRTITELNDWYTQFAQAILLLVALTAFAAQILFDSGALDWRRAHYLTRRLAERTTWPPDLPGCRLLPEVKALREALHIDASPALMLLRDPRPQVRMAALTALEFRKYWRAGQPELVLQVAHQASEPALRSAAVTALANVDDRLLVEELAEFLRDSSPDVRRAASEALLWDMANRWPWIRLAVRRALADNQLMDQTPILAPGQQLTAEAQKDLTAWAAEKGFLAVRAARVLRTHYERVLAEGAEEDTVEMLRRQLANSETPPSLRIELAQLLHAQQLLDRKVLERLLDPMNPAPLRLLAADTLLAEGPHEAAAGALRNVGKFPNREIALATADVAQRRLGINLGLPVGQPLPPVQSRLAAEVTRRVMAWGAEHDADPAEMPADTSHS